MEMIMIKDAAKNLGVESHVLRYWEEELGLEIKRNSMGHRYYDARDIKMFKEVKDLRDRGFSLKDIKDGIERQKKLLREAVEDKDELRLASESKIEEKRNFAGGIESKIEEKLSFGGENKSKIGEELLEKTECEIGESAVGIIGKKEVERADVKSSGQADGRNIDGKTEVHIHNNHRQKNAQGKDEGSAHMDEEKGVCQDEVEAGNQLKIVDFKTAQMQNIMNKIVANAFVENRDIITSSIKSEITTDVMKQFDTVMREKEEKEEERYKKLNETIRMLQKGQEEVAATKVKKGLFKRRRK